MKYAIILSVLAAPVFADCSVGTDYSDEIAKIVGDMQAAPDPGSAQVLSGEMWEIWLDAPDELAQALLFFVFALFLFFFYFSIFSFLLFSSYASV